MGNINQTWLLKDSKKWSKKDIAMAIERLWNERKELKHE